MPKRDLDSTHPARILARMTKSRKTVARLGGKARAKKLTKAQRSASARKAARARWAKRDTVVFSGIPPADSVTASQMLDVAVRP